MIIILLRSHYVFVNCFNGDILQWEQWYNLTSIELLNRLWNEYSTLHYSTAWLTLNTARQYE